MAEACGVMLTRWPISIAFKQYTKTLSGADPSLLLLNNTQRPDKALAHLCCFQTIHKDLIRRWPISAFKQYTKTLSGAGPSLLLSNSAQRRPDQALAHLYCFQTVHKEDFIRRWPFSIAFKQYTETLSGADPSLLLLNNTQRPDKALAHLCCFQTIHKDLIRRWPISAFKQYTKTLSGAGPSLLLSNSTQRRPYQALAHLCCFQTVHKEDFIRRWPFSIAFKQYTKTFSGAGPSLLLSNSTQRRPYQTLAHLYCFQAIHKDLIRRWPISVAFKQYTKTLSGAGLSLLSHNTQRPYQALAHLYCFQTIHKDLIRRWPISIAFKQYTKKTLSHTGPSLLLSNNTQRPYQALAHLCCFQTIHKDLIRRWPISAFKQYTKTLSSAGPSLLLSNNTQRPDQALAHPYCFQTIHKYLIRRLPISIAFKQYTKKTLSDAGPSLLLSNNTQRRPYQT